LGAVPDAVQRVWPGNEGAGKRPAAVVLCELPGVGSDDVDIALERRVLTVRARAAEHEHPGCQRVYTEYAKGDCARVFTLSEDIDRDRIEATA